MSHCFWAAAAPIFRAPRSIPTERFKPAVTYFCWTTSCFRLAGITSNIHGQCFWFHTHAHDELRDAS